MTAKAMDGLWVRRFHASREGKDTEKKQRKVGLPHPPLILLHPSSFAPLREKFVPFGGHSAYGGIAAVIAVNWG